MKLRNKKTGEIGTLIVDGAYNFVANFAVEDDERNRLGEYASLAELNEEWCDYEEPKVYFVNAVGSIDKNSYTDERTKRNFSEQLKQIGNYFETKEEAEKAVEKLKAWKRLKDKGVEFYGWRKNPTGTYDFLARWKGVPPRMNEIINDLDLLFRGEE